MRKSKPKPVSPANPKSVVVGLAQHLTEYRRTLARLAGIVNAIPKHADTDTVIHSLKSIVGYRRNTLRNANRLLATFTELDRMLSEME